MKNSNNNNVNKNNVNNETKLVCPKCGAEFEIPQHETTVKNATVLGADSNMGTIYMKLKNRQEQLKAAGIDTTKYFSMQTPNGTERLMKWDGDTPVAVTADDPVLKAIMDGGAIPNRDLFRRWVMAQVFTGLTFKGWRGAEGFTDWVHYKGYKYTFSMTEEELRVQAKLWKKSDVENFQERNRWFNKFVVLAMVEDYMDKLSKHINSRKIRHCKGVEYIKLNGQNIFKSDIYRKVTGPLHNAIHSIQSVKNPEELYRAFHCFNSIRVELPWDTQFSADWFDAYKGSGAYYTMKNMLMFHGCKFRDCGRFMSKQASLNYLEMKANEYKKEGWRLFGLMKKLIQDNGIDIKAKQAEWAAKKNK